MERDLNNGIGISTLFDKKAKQAEEGLEIFLDEDIEIKTGINFSKNKKMKGCNFNFYFEYLNEKNKTLGYYCAMVTYPNISLRLAILDGLIFKNKIFGTDPDKKVNNFFCLSYPSSNIVYNPNEFILWVTEYERKMSLESLVKNKCEEKYGINYSICQDAFTKNEVDFLKRDSWEIEYDGFVFNNHSKYAIVGFETWSINSNGERYLIKKIKEHFWYSLNDRSWKQKVKKTNASNSLSPWEKFLKWRSGK